MAKTIKYRKIYGCPKHGTTKGTVVTLKKTSNNGVEEKIPCFRCDACKKEYLDPENVSSGDTRHRVGKFAIWNTIGPFPVPENVYLYEKQNNKKLCSCPGNIKKKTRLITHLLLKNGTTASLPGARVCIYCNKVFITLGIYGSHKKLFEENNIGVLHIDEESKDETHIQKDEDKKNLQNDQNMVDGWEEAVFDIEDYQVPEASLEELIPASKVASAYYDAKISYNPYQYLPWLKMYINGSKNLLISDEVGLGKTIEAGILIMEELTENVNSKIIVVCPAFLREKWYQELNEKFLFDSQIYDGKTALDSMTNIVILPISRIKQYMENECSFDYSMVIVDEVHYFKNSNSARYGHLKKFLEKVGDCKRVFMSATPVNNSGNDYHSIECLFASKPDRTNTTKKQAYIYLPERNVEDIYVELTKKEQEFYDATDALDPFSGTIYRHIGASCLYALSRYAYSGNELTSETKEELRSSLEALLDGYSVDEINDDCFSEIKKLPAPEMDSKIVKLRDILNTYEPGCKIVLFSHYIETVKYLHSELSGDFNTGYIYANTISNNIPCKNIINKFIDAKNWFCKDTDKTTILICSDTCREGIDLDMANVLINYDLPFNPSILEQRIGRIDRMSQKKDMHIYNFHVNGTYDDRLHFILSAKLRFINFYADYGIGNPLNITSEGNHTFDSFIRYFGRKFKETKNYAIMSNDDYYVASRILRQVGVKLDKKDGMDGLRMQAILLDRLNENQELIEKWFDKGEIKRITEEQLLMQRDELEKLLNFPKKIDRSIILDTDTLRAIVTNANKNPQFRKRIAILIKNYENKLMEMEISGMPMVIDINDLRTEYSFGTGDTDDFIQSSVIELLRKEGAKVYENN